MATATADIVEHSNFTYQGIAVPALRINREVLADLGTGEQASVLAPKSVPYAWKVGEYLVGRDQPASFEAPVRNAGKMVSVLRQVA